ncbi:acyl-CoA dehydrogenase [Streptomyces pilosus]|uniref:acyl-CoA dehydrogenase family protein n=1 Tax=Streptomyces pilosus TaxID=28893 RepID=UPI00167A8B57|nr:acyl-CoA dehydrogenase family protein [Streptomyces pilosus]GGV45916.1 acyl-CoA dehydrogenase [Streptomyces pilosus]
MSFAPSEEQEELASTVRRLLDRRSDSAAVRGAVAEPPGYDTDLWRTLCDQVGVAALAVPEEYGGAGFSLCETHVVLEQLGAALTPGPLLGSAVLAAQALLLSGDTRACERLLPGIAEGTSVAALAWAGEDSRWRTDRCGVRAARESGGWALCGTATLVLDGADADVLLAVAETGTEGLGLFEVDPADARLRRTGTPAMDTTLRLARIDFDGVPALPLLLDAGPALETLHDIAAVAITALQVGAARRGMDMTVAHCKERVQFGRPLGSFQALKHRMADMLVQVETAQAVSWAAAVSAAERQPDLPRRAALAKAWCSEALNHVAAEAVQLHGGIAVTWEHDAQMIFKRAHSTSQLFGQSHEHRQRLFRLLEPASAAAPVAS